jgi:four helix bundle protein
MARYFRNIKAWKYADDLVLSIYSVTKCFPKEEIYGITSQLRRSAVSVAANIAEGATRQNKKEYLHFLYIAKASLAEVDYLLHLSERLKYITESNCCSVENLDKKLLKHCLV